MYVDANGDGDVADPGEQGPTIHAATLKAETGGRSRTASRPAARSRRTCALGVYHERGLQCASGCSIDVDNVQVVG